MTACSGDTKSEARQENTTTTSAAVDITALDTGDYPTEPAAAFGEATPEEIASVDGQRMAEYMVAPYEVDPEMTDPTLPTFVVRNYLGLKGALGQEVIDVPANKSSAIYGFIASAATVTGERDGATRAMTNLVMRYTTAEGAADAARQMSEASALRPGAMAVDIPGLPNSHGISGTGVDGKVTLAVFTPWNDYVLYTWVGVPQDQATLMESLIVRTQELQGPRIDQFPRTPTKSQNGGKPASLQVDQNDILVYALPAKADAPMGATDRAVYGPRGMSLLYTPPADVYRTLTEHGADHTAVYLTTVYRASTPDDATEMLAAFDRMNRTDGWSTMPGPTGLPTAQCITKSTMNGEQFLCSVQVGRYIGTATTLDDRTDVLQQIAAQYVILTKADQNAG